MKLPRAFVEACQKHGVEVYFADRKLTKYWNKHRTDGEPLMYGGWYWNHTRKGRVTAQDEDGPFRTESAAFRDAYVKLQIRISR